MTKTHMVRIMLPHDAYVCHILDKHCRPTTHLSYKEYLSLIGSRSVPLVCIDPATSGIVGIMILLIRKLDVVIGMCVVDPGHRRKRIATTMFKYVWRVAASRPTIISYDDAIDGEESARQGLMDALGYKMIGVCRDSGKAAFLFARPPASGAS